MRRTVRVLVAGSLVVGASLVAWTRFEHEPVIPLKVRVHVMASQESEVLNCTRSRRDVRRLVREANRYWKQAGIRWKIESVRRREARAADGLDEMLTAQVKTDREEHDLREAVRGKLEAAMPEHGWLDPGLDLVLVESFGPFGAGFYDDSGRIYLAHRGAVEVGVVDEIVPVILAHEFGHALGLSHVPCEQEDNLMLGRCKTRHRSAYKLSEDQIRAAREMAAQVNQH